MIFVNASNFQVQAVSEVDTEKRPKIGEESQGSRGQGAARCRRQPAERVVSNRL